MTNIYEHHIYVPYPGEPGRVGALANPIMTTQPILQITDPFFRGTALFHCAVCDQWLKNQCIAKDPNECVCLEINMVGHTKEHGGEPYLDVVRATMEVVSPRLRDYLIENVPGLEQMLHGAGSEWDISELTKDVPPESTT